MRPSPDNFIGVEVRPAKYLPFGEQGPYSVLGFVKDEQPVVIFADIPTKQIAEKVLDVYIERHVKDTYFSGYDDQYEDC
jgi:hypothetical protein